MQALARSDPRLIVTGEVPDVRTYLNRAAVFVCPVRMGSGMRGKILEAMASGTAVVTTSLGAEGIPAVLGENCLLADDPEMMANQIEWLLSDEPLRRRLAENARRMVVERLSWERTVQRLEETLAELVER
jgi:glycosyltransferase involved in cell wall biosynthesis